MDLHPDTFEKHFDEITFPACFLPLITPGFNNTWLYSKIPIMLQASVIKVTAWNCLEVQFVHKTKNNFISAAPFTGSLKELCRTSTEA